MNIGDVSPGELDDGCLILVRLVWLDQQCRARTDGLCEGYIEILYFITGCLIAISVRKVVIGHEDRHVTEVQCDPDAPVGVARATDLYAGSLSVVGDDFAF